MQVGKADCVPKGSCVAQRDVHAWELTRQANCIESSSYMRPAVVLVSDLLVMLPV